MIFNDFDRIVFAGDSITDMESQRPVGEGLFNNLGFGYVRMVENMLSAWYPDLRIRVTNSGIDENTSRDLLDRFERDVISLNPDWVSILIGANDVWRQFDCPAMRDRQVMIDEYENNLETMILSIKDKVKGIFIGSPYYMEPLENDPMRKLINEYAAVAKKLAEKHDCYFIDYQTMYDKYFQYRHSSYISWDRIHPNQVGATLMARTFLTACGFDFERAISD